MIGKYMIIDPETGEHLHRDHIAEGMIKQSLNKGYKKSNKTITQDEDDFFDSYGLPRKANIGETAIDNAGKVWTYKKEGWYTDEYDEFGVDFTEEDEYEVVVAHRKKHWLDNFDLTNKHVAKDWKSEWLDQFDFSGNNVWGKMDGGDIDLGNPLGENSTIYGSMDSKGLGIGGGGDKLKAWADKVNKLPYFFKGFKIGKGSIKQGMNLYDHFSNDNNNEMNIIYNDSIFMHTQVEIDSPFAKHYQLERMEWGVKQPKKFQPDSKKIWIFRKDSTKKTNSIRRSYDSVKKSLGFDD